MLAARRRHRHRAKIRSSSCDWAIAGIARGIIYLMSIYRIAVIMSALMKIIAANMSRCTVAHHAGSDESTIRNTIAMISWIMSIQMDILPYTSSSAPLSLRSLTMIMVLLRASDMAIYPLVTRSNHNPRAIPMPIRVVKSTCPIQITNDAFPSSLICLGLSPSQTINSNKAIPIWENVSICSVWWRRFSHKGHINIPQKIYQINNGCFNTFMI